MKMKPKGKWIDPVRATAISNETTIQKYVSFVNFEVIQEKMTLPNYSNPLLQRQAYLHYSLQSTNGKPPFTAQQDTKFDFSSVLPAATTKHQGSSIESLILPIEKEQVIVTREDSCSEKDNAHLYKSAFSVIGYVLQGLIKTLSKSLEFKLNLSLLCKRIDFKLELKTNLKCD